MTNFDIESSVKEIVTSEIDSFRVHDEDLRKTIIESGKTFNSNDRLDPASTYLFNRIMQEIRTCRKNNILFPLNYLIIYDIMYYLEHYYYKNLDPAMNSLSSLLNDYTKRSFIQRFFHKEKLYRDILTKRLELICTYNNTADYFNYFDITREGDKVLEYALSEADPSAHHKIIDYHKEYHTKMDNKYMLSKIK